MTENSNSMTVDMAKKVAKNIYKFLLYIAIIALFCVVINKDSQTLNYYLKRGSVLEYSISKNQKVDVEKINDVLANLNVVYSSVDEEENDFEILDNDNEKIEKKLFIALSILPRNQRKDTFNAISDYIFKNYPNSKLLNIKPLNNFFNDKYSVFINITTILILTTFIWGVIIYLTLSENILKDCFNNSKNFFVELCSKTKEKGVGYLFKKLLLDDYKDDDTNETNITKEIIGTIIFVLCALIIIRYFVGELRWIPSGSMHPTLLEKDRVYVEKLEYPHKEINRGDILVFYPPSTELSKNPLKVFFRLTGIFCKDMAYIKRVVALPNDVFEIKYSKELKEYKVYINNVALNEPYINSKANWSECTDGMYCGPFVVPEGKYFMMGDNRGNSLDSRYWGFLDKDRIIGRAIFTFWPISRMNNLKDEYIELHKEEYGSRIIESSFIVNRY